METVNNHLIDKIVSGLRATAVELEELQVQLALGKAEAADKFEAVKEATTDFIQSALQSLKKTNTKAETLKSKLEELQVQLVLVKADSKDAFALRKKQIEKIVKEIEDLVDSGEIDVELRLKWNGEVQKFKVLMEILLLQFELGKMELREEVEKNKVEFIKRIEKLKTKFEAKRHSAEGAFETFWHEAKSAYHDLKTAFTKQ